MVFLKCETGRQVVGHQAGTQLHQAEAIGTGSSCPLNGLEAWTPVFVGQAFCGGVGWGGHSGPSLAERRLSKGRVRTLLVSPDT